MQPSSPTAACPSGSSREFRAISDVHIGFLSSSLGTFGADGCPETTTAWCANGATSSNNDHGHLVTRTDPCASSTVPTYESEGFLAWDPGQTDKPPGTATLDADGGTAALVPAAVDLATGIGAIGCGFAQQNEAWYRFLIDPDPYATISLSSNGQVVTQGSDSALLAQRAEFLRPTSLVAVVVVSNKPDGSIKESSDYPLVADLSSYLPHATSACTTNGPTDPCCVSCSASTPTGCTPDPNCESDPDYTSADEDLAIRGFGLISDKQRFGVEFFYQPSRYVSALTSAMVTNELGKTAPNPLFSGGRDPSHVFYATITGVPWQLIARQSKGTPDLVNGVSALNPKDVGGFKTYAELELTDGKGHTFWQDIAGDPENYVAAISPYMQEATVPRSGTDPITGIEMTPPETPTDENPINGREWSIPQPPGDLEYVCIWPIAPIDCSAPGAIGCECASNTEIQENPVCAPNPNDNGAPTLQTYAYAYPGVKHLAIAQGMKQQGIVASICPKQLTSPTNPDGSVAIDYGYRPAAYAIINALKGAIGQ
jgi:hypothetical protein